MPSDSEKPPVLPTPPDDNPRRRLVAFDGPKDPDHPHNWSRLKKVSFVAIVSAKIFVVSFASSIFGSGTTQVVNEFHTSNIVAQLGVALYIVGFATGPLLFGPLSEIVGNSPPMIFGCIACALLQIPLALVHGIASVLVVRFLAGATGSAVLGVGAGMVSELYEPIPRAVALSVSTSMINLGSTVAPIVGSYVTERYGWRWTAWVTLIMFASLEPFALFALRESSPKRILIAKAKRLRSKGRPECVTPAEEEKVDVRALINTYLSKPLRLFCLEPILVVLTVYQTFVYGLLYLAYQTLPLAFERRGWSVTTSTLPFVAVLLGCLCAPAVIMTFTLTWFKRRYEARDGVIVPEDRLPPMILGAAILPLALVWFGWSMSTHWFAQVLAAYFIGASVILIFISGIVYIVDVYTSCANSAVSIQVVFRSVFAASFPLWTRYLYNALGLEWMYTLLAGVGALLFPFTVVFFIFGKKIRSWSSFTN